VLQIISARFPIDQQDSDEVEIDIDSLDTATLRQLQKYVRTVEKNAASKRAPKKPKPKASQSNLATARQASAESSERIRQLEAQLMGEVGGSGGADSSDSDVSESDGEEVVMGGSMGSGMAGFNSLYE